MCHLLALLTNARLASGMSSNIDMLKSMYTTRVKVQHGSCMGLHHLLSLLHTFTYFGNFHILSLKYPSKPKDHQFRPLNPLQLEELLISPDGFAANEPL